MVLSDSHSNLFVLTVPPNLDNVDKALILGAAFLVVSDMCRIFTYTTFSFNLIFHLNKASPYLNYDPIYSRARRVTKTSYEELVI